MKVGKISVLEFLAIIVVNRCFFNFSFMPTAGIAPANQDAWLAEILSGLLIFISVSPLMIMATHYRDKTYEEYVEIILGKVIGKVFGIIYAIYLTVVIMLTIVFLSDFLVSAVLPDTPLYAILLFMLLPCMYATFKGLEAIGRASIIFGIFIISVVLLYFILNFNNMDFSYFFPIFWDSTPSEFAFGIFANAMRFCDAFVFFTLLPYVENNEKYPVVKIMFILVCSFTLINMIVTIATQAVLGPELAKTYRYPYYISIQNINLFDIIQRIEFFNVIGWIIILFVKLSSTVLSASIVLMKVFNTKSYRPFIIPVNLVAFAAIMFTSYSHFIIFRTFIHELAHFIILTANTIIPTFILIIYMIRRRVGAIE